MNTGDRALLTATGIRILLEKCNTRPNVLLQEIGKPLTQMFLGRTEQTVGVGSPAAALTKEGLMKLFNEFRETDRSLRSKDSAEVDTAWCRSFEVFERLGEHLSIKKLTLDGPAVISNFPVACGIKVLESSAIEEDTILLLSRGVVVRTIRLPKPIKPMAPASCDPYEMEA